MTKRHELPIQEFAELAASAWRRSDEERCMLLACLDALPVPFWIKRPKPENGEMLFVNIAYCQRWGIEREAYVGHTDADIWGREVALNFAENDAAALECAPDCYFIKEPVPEVPGDDAKNAPQWLIVKRAVRWHGEVAVVGLAVLGGEAEEMFSVLGTLGSGAR